MYIRTDQHYVYGALSTDSGGSWGIPGAFTDLPAPAAPSTMVRMPDGGLIVAYNHREDGVAAGWRGRTPLSVARSRDEGCTWRGLADLESSPEYGYGYASLRPSGDSLVMTYYVWPQAAVDSFAQTSLRYRILPLARFT